MSVAGKLKPGLATLVAATAAVAVAGLLFASGASSEELKHYDSSKKDFWLHPPDDWFMGDETQEQKGTHVLNTLPPPTGFTNEEIEATLKTIKLPPGFKIELWASGLPGARQMAWGDNGALYVGSFLNTNVYAVVDEGGKRTVKTILKGMKMPTGVAYRDGALYVADIDKIYKYNKPDGVLDNMPKPEVVYDDMPPYIPHGWKYLAFDKNGWLYVAFGPPCNICLPPTSTSQIRHVDPATGLAEIVALGVRNSVGGDVDPRTGDYWFTENARDWLGDDIPSDKLNHITRIGEDFGYPYCHQGDIPDPKLAMGHKCSEFSPPALKLGAHRYIDSQTEDVAKVLNGFGGAKLILATVTNAKAISSVIEGLGLDGKLLVVGASFEPIEVTPIQLIGARRQIVGWPSGTSADSEDTLRFSALTGVRPMVETYPLEKAAAAYTRMMSGKARFRVVIVP